MKLLQMASDLEITQWSSSTAIEEISGTLDNLSNATVQKTDTVNKLAAALRTATEDIS